MTALDDRIRALAPPAEQQPTPVAELRRRGARRRARQRVVAGVATFAVVAVVVALAVVRPSGHDPDAVVAEPPVEELGPGSEQITFGGAEGVTLTVSPATGLVDGQSVEVSVDGLERLPGAQLAMCRGDLQEPVGLDDCDLGALGESRPATDTQTVVVSAALTFAGAGARYDCAAEPAGCVLAVGTTAPLVQGVAVPVDFLPGTAPPVDQASLSISPAAGLAAGDLVSVSAQGLPANRSFRLIQCAPRLDDPSVCVGDAEVGYWNVVAGAEGTFSTAYGVKPVVWSSWDGAVDCTVTDCRLQLLDTSWTSVATSEPLRFADGVVADLPRLVLDPAGPFVDGQEIEVRGSGFTPGVTVGGRLGQCPAALDTRVEERCTYGTGFGDVVSEEGTFVVRMTVREALIFTGSCREGAGCMVAWVINHGPTVAEVPLTFR